MLRCGVPPPPPPPHTHTHTHTNNFERLKLPQQIIYRRKGNLSESPNHFKHRKNILISRFYEQFLRSSRILGLFLEVRKNFKFLEHKHIIYHFEAGDWRFQIYNLFLEKFKFRVFTKAFKNFAKYIITFIFAKFKYFEKKNIYLESPDHPLQNDI